MKMGPKKHPRQTYWDQVRDKAAALGADGCTKATGAYVECCLEHDIHYRTGHTIAGEPITRRAADARFRSCMQSRSRLGWYSPMAWARWAAVRIFGRTVT